MIIKIKEKILIDRIKKNDSEAFGEIYDEYVKKVYRFIFFKVPTEEVAEDLSHEVFINLLDYLKKTDRAVESLQALVYSISRNLIAHYYQTEGSKNKTGELLENVDYEADKSLLKEEDVEILVDKKIDKDLLQKAIRKIKNDNYREIIILRFIEDLSFKEIAQILNKEPSVLRVLLHRALEELKKVYNKLKES